MFWDSILSWFKIILAFLGFNKTSRPYKGDAEEGKGKAFTFKKGGDESKTLLSQGNH